MARGRSVYRIAATGSLRVPHDRTTVTGANDDRARRRRDSQHPICQPERLDRPLCQGVDGSTAPRLDDHATGVISACGGVAATCAVARSPRSPASGDAVGVLLTGGGRHAARRSAL